MPNEHIGTVAGYDLDGQAVRMNLEGALAVGDRIHIVGARRVIDEIVARINVAGEHVHEAHAGESVGVWCPEQVSPGARVYRVDDGVRP